MNEPTLTQLKILVERAVRPVRASIARKRKMREELLAHVVGVFEEESANLGDERAAVERTALRFGDPAEVTSRLQESVPVGDLVARFFEGRPGEAAMWVPLRIACVAYAGELVGFFAVLFLADWVAVLPRETMIIFGSVFLAPPVFFVSVAFLTDWIEKGVYDPPGVSRVRVALSAAGWLLFMLLFVSGVVWSLCPTGWDSLGLGVALRYAGMLAAFSMVLAWNLAHWNAPRRHYHEEWGRLPIDIPS
jgi:ATP-dependent Clp protease ATP-binding subunit ClpC